MVVIVAHLIVVESAFADLALEGTREIDLDIQPHELKIIVEEIVHAPSHLIEHFSIEPIQHVWDGVGVIWLVCLDGAECLQLVHDRAGDMVRVDLRFAPLLVV